MDRILSFEDFISFAIILAEFAKQDETNKEIAKSDELRAKISKLKQQKSVILRNRNSNELLEKTQLLIEILNDSPKYITEMNNELFEELITKITVKDNEMLNFHLINSLVLT